MKADDDEDDWDMLTAVAQTVINNNSLAIASLFDEDEELRERVAVRSNFRNQPRGPKTQFRHKEALHCIRRDYLGIVGDPSTPLFIGKDFEMMFRITRPRFQRLMEDVGNAGIKFFTDTVDCYGQEGASMEARLLLPLKCLAYGVPPHCFTDYFQMSKTLAKDCCIQFDLAIKKIYQKEYLRLPTPTDLKNICKLHKAVHGVDGMFGSLDCMHTLWKNCPVAWQGSFEGKEGKPSIVLEAIADYHLWFWHGAYGGYAGTLNDETILNLSPFLESLVDGSFVRAEAKSEAVPFEVGTEEFHALFILVDGIYPKYSRFVKGMKEPVTTKEKVYTGWQEAVRKDIERAFGVLQSKFQVLQRPILLKKLKRIANKVASCMILHNMCVSDRVMGDPRAQPLQPCF